MTRDTARTSLPTIDLRRFDAEGDERRRFLQELRDAARTYGFFYLVGHGVEDRLIQSVLALSRRFFSLPDREKLEIEMVNSPHFRGYNRAGFEYTRGKQDWREQVDIGAERPALPLDPGSPAWTAASGPEPVAFRASRTEAGSARLSGEGDGAGGSGAAGVLGRAGTARRRVRADLRARARTSSSRSSAIPAARRERAIRAWARTRTWASWRSSCRTRSRAFRSKARTAGSTRRRFPDPSSSTSARFSKSRPAAICAPTCTASSRRRPATTGFRSPSSSAPGSTPKCPLLALPPHLAAEARGVTQDPLNPLFREAGRNYLKGRLRSHPDVARRHHADLLEPSDGKPELASAY